MPTTTEIRASAVKAAGFTGKAAAALLLNETTDDQFRIALAEAKDIQVIAQMVAPRFEADGDAVAADVIAAGISLKDFRSGTVNALAEADQHIDTSRRLGVNDVFAQRSAQIDAHNAARRDTQRGKNV